MLGEAGKRFGLKPRRLIVDRYVGIALRELGRDAESERVLRDALRRARDAGADDTVSRIRDTLADLDRQRDGA